MIAMLRGKVAHRLPTQIIFDVNGVGYLLNISLNTLEKLPEDSNEIVTLYTYLVVREDAMELYGFYSLNEKKMFELLLTVHGVGPKLSLNVLSRISVTEFKYAVMNGEVARIKAIPGVGNKIAEKILIDLRDKVAALAGDDTIENSSMKARSEAIQALTVLGYNQKLAETTSKAILIENPDYNVEDLVRASLIRLSQA